MERSWATKRPAAGTDEDLPAPRDLAARASGTSRTRSATEHAPSQPHRRPGRAVTVGQDRDPPCGPLGPSSTGISRRCRGSRAGPFSTLPWASLWLLWLGLFLFFFSVSFVCSLLG